jgi:hypothetical protein
LSWLHLVETIEEEKREDTRASLASPGECRLEGGVNRRDLKIINFEHAPHPGLGLETNNNEYRVRKIVLIAMSCSINADNLGS